MLAVLLSIIDGLALPIQTSVNDKLGQKAHSPYIASAVSCGTAAVILLVIDLIVEGSLNIPFDKMLEYPAWIWCGGLCSLAFVVISVICLPHVGSATVLTLTAFGQMIASLIVDQTGWLGSEVIDLTLIHIIGAIVFAVGVVFIAREPRQASAPKSEHNVRYLALCFLAGVIGVIQMAITGTVTIVTGSNWYSTTITMTVGFFAALILIALLYLVKGRSSVFTDGPNIPFKWYMLTGGALGIVCVGAAAYTVPIIGTGMTTIFCLAGFMVGGLIVDAIGFLGIKKKPVTKIKIVGVILMIIGSAVVSLL